MPLDHKQEFDRLKEVFRKKKQERQNVYIATAVDVTPLAGYGYFIAQLKDATTVNVQSWLNLSISAGQQVMIMPISDQPWATYVLIGVNASTDLATTPYVAPTQDGSALTSVDWSKVDTTTNKVALDTQVSGTLPVANQARQITKVTYSFSTGTIASGATLTGTAAGANALLVRSLSLTGGSQATLALLEQPLGVVEYQTISLATPFYDQGPWVHYDALSASSLYWSVTNDGAASASFTITLTGLAFAV